jgi:hypothetical protein
MVSLSNLSRKKMTTGDGNDDNVSILGCSLICGGEHPTDDKGDNINKRPGCSAK